MERVGTEIAIDATQLTILPTSVPLCTLDARSHESRNVPIYGDLTPTSQNLSKLTFWRLVDQRLTLHWEMVARDSSRKTSFVTTVVDGVTSAMLVLTRFA